MKRIVFIVIMSLFASTMSFASNAGDEVSKSKLVSLISEYSSHEGFEVVKVGSFGVAAIKSLIKVADSDPEVRELVKALKGIKRIAIVEFDDCSDRDKEAFTRKLDKVLRPADVLMEVKDGSEKMMIYGVVDDKGGKVSDFVMYAPEDCALICLFGSINVDSIIKLAES